MTLVTVTVAVWLNGDISVLLDVLSPSVSPSVASASLFAAPPSDEDSSAASSSVVSPPIGPT